jgi:hypothetical protein
MATRRALILTIFIAAVGVRAATTQSPQTPPNGFSFESKWACNGQFGNGKQDRSSYQGSSILGGSWVQLKEVDLEPAGYQGLYIIGYDKTKNQVIESDANNFGNAFYTSDGWQNGTLTLILLPDSKALNNRFVFHLADTTHCCVDWEVNRANEWKKSDHLDCTHEAHP